MQPLQQENEEEAEVLNGASDYGADDGDDGNDDVNDFVEESMAMLNGADDDDLGEPELDAPEESVGEVDPPTPVAAKKKPGRPSKKHAAVSAKVAAVQRKPAPAVLEEQGEADDQEEDEQPEEEEDQEPTPKQAKPVPGRRGRPAKAANPPAAAAPAPFVRGAKKRRSLEGATETEPDQPDPKRQRTSPAGEPKKRGRPPKTATAEPSSAAAAKPKPRGRGRKPSPDADIGDTSHISIARRPPLPKSRGLLINRPTASRHERPDDPDSSMRRTRSGRTSFKPLAYWRNERVEFDRGEAEDTFVGRKRIGRFVLPSVSGIVRVDEPEVEVKRAGAGRRGRRKSTAAAAGGKRGRRKSGAAGYNGDDYDESGAHAPAEVWELDPGTVTGEVVVWQPEYEFSPPAPNDIINVIDKQLAISSAAIKTTEVVGGEFRYAKVFSEGFIGAGVVDLPPGAVKRLKNSRKVFMIFFVHAGRVLVTVQETSFRISRGGIFIVPRCKCSLRMIHTYIH